jgi:hypothetical protein
VALFNECSCFVRLEQVVFVSCAWIENVAKQRKKENFFSILKEFIVLV